MADNDDYVYYDEDGEAYFEEREFGPSRSQKKRDATALQKLGEKLVKMKPQQLAAMQLPEDLQAAVVEYNTMRKNEARRRQLQYIGKLMRDIDTVQLETDVLAIEAGDATETARFRAIEEWRDRLVQGDFDPLDEIIALCPDIDVAHIRTLARNAMKEAKSNKPVKSGKTLFRYLRDTVDTSSLENE